MNKRLAIGLLTACFLTPATAQAQGVDGTLSGRPDSWTMSPSHAVSLNACFTEHHRDVRGRSPQPPGLSG